jgi:hypothetical protein
MLSEAMRQLRARRDECFVWATHAGAELDLLIVPSMTSAIEMLGAATDILRPLVPLRT